MEGWVFRAGSNSPPPHELPVAETRVSHWRRKTRPKKPSPRIGRHSKNTELPDKLYLTLDGGQASSHVAMQFNGAPVVNLSGCTIRSNTSIDCNGHDGNVPYRISTHHW